jgi:proline racemase
MCDKAPAGLTHYDPSIIEARVIHHYKTIDAHVGGQPLRLIVEGMPRPSGKSLLQKRDWLHRHADEIRRAVVLEPRGHADMVGAALTEPASPEAHAGLIFMDAAGYPVISGHGLIATATIAIERGLIFPGAPAGSPNGNDEDIPEIRIVFDTAAGTVHTRARCETRGGARRVDSVAFTNVPCFVHSAAHRVRLGARELRVDIAFGGAFYAVVDTEAAGIPLRAERIADLRRLGADIQAALNASSPVEHPTETALAGVAGVVFTGPPDDPEAHLRNVTVSGAAIDRSPSGTGTSAVMAVLDAMGLLPEGQTFVHESLTGALFRGRALRRTLVGDVPALVPEIEGAAWITGEHTFLLDDDDPWH